MRARASADSATAAAVPLGVAGVVLSEPAAAETAVPLLLRTEWMRFATMALLASGLDACVRLSSTVRSPKFCCSACGLTGCRVHSWHQLAQMKERSHCTACVSVAFCVSISMLRY